MKKISYVFVAAAVVMAAASCDKIQGLINGENGNNEEQVPVEEEKELTPDEQKVKIEETATSLMALMDKSQWGAEYENVMVTVESLDQKDLDSKDIEAYLKDIVDAWSIVKGEEGSTITYTVAHLTQIKGHFTENSEGKFDFQDADDFSVTVFDGEIPVTATFAAKDEAATPAHFADLDDDVTIYIPASSTFSISKNNEVIGLLEIRLSPKDLNGDNYITKEDAIIVSYTMKVGAYTFDLSQADVSTEHAVASARILKSDQLIIGVTLDAIYTYINEYYEEDGANYHYVALMPTKVNASVDLAGKMQIRFDVPDGTKLQEVTEEVNAAQINGDEKAFKDALAELEKLYSFGVYYDGGNTIQATIGFEPVFDEVDQHWNYNPVIRFADGTSYAVEDYFSQENFGDFANELMNWVNDLMDYLGIQLAATPDEPAQ
ncbi:MAG: hypothetical protein K6E61_04375 [Bacteroidales bacterium]|nr:hypothetical protein [Bacteroidales bacterium]